MFVVASTAMLMAIGSIGRCTLKGLVVPMGTAPRAGNHRIVSRVLGKGKTATAARCAAEEHTDRLSFH